MSSGSAVGTFQSFWFYSLIDWGFVLCSASGYFLFLQLSYFFIILIFFDLFLCYFSQIRVIAPKIQLRLVFLLKVTSALYKWSLLLLYFWSSVLQNWSFALKDTFPLLMFCIVRYFYRHVFGIFLVQKLFLLSFLLSAKYALIFPPLPFHVYTLSCYDVVLSCCSIVQCRCL